MIRISGKVDNPNSYNGFSSDISVVFMKEEWNITAKPVVFGL